MEGVGRVGALRDGVFQGDGPPVEERSAPRKGRLFSLASDERLVSRVRAGSDDAFAVLYERHCSSLLSFCRHMLGSREEAEDAVQQTWANAYRALVSGGERELRLRPWLYRIARNQCISRLRARRPTDELTEFEASPVGLAEEVHQRGDLRDLLADLAGLPHDQREALVLSELHDNSHAEVARIIGCDREKVKSLVFQARTSLISSRAAREVSCEEIRRQLAVLRGGSLRRSVVSRHLKGCEGCRWYRDEVRNQRAALAILLPVAPGALMKGGAAAAIAAAGAKASGAAGTAVGAASGIAATGGAAAASGGVAASSGSAAGLGISGGMLKGIAVTLAVTTAAAGGAATVKVKRHDRHAASGRAATQQTVASRPQPAVKAVSTPTPALHVAVPGGSASRSHKHSSRSPSTTDSVPGVAAAPPAVAPPASAPEATLPPAAPVAEEVRPDPAHRNKATPKDGRPARDKRPAARRRVLAKREEAAAIRLQDRARRQSDKPRAKAKDRPARPERPGKAKAQGPASGPNTPAPLPPAPLAPAP